MVILARFDQVMVQSLHKRTDFKCISTYPIIFFIKVWTNLKKHDKISNFPSIHHHSMLSRRVDMCTLF